jgi:hypothetical protein
MANEIKKFWLVYTDGGILIDRYATYQDANAEAGRRALDDTVAEHFILETVAVRCGSESYGRRHRPIRKDKTISLLRNS